jgi:hypothetical protein
VSFIVRRIPISKTNIIIRSARFRQITASIRFSEFVLKETESDFFAKGETADNIIRMNQQTGE